MMKVIQCMLRKPIVLKALGRGHSSLYADIADGLMVSPVRTGRQSVGWPDYEIAAINRARIAGKTDDEIRSLVRELHAKREECVA